MNKLYIKSGCPWCRDAIQWLDAHGISYQTIDVLIDRSSYDEMIALSGQTKTPTLQTEDKRVLADFDVAQLPAFLALE
ncbi:MAG: glutaredoxin family protein [Verrucomicrobiae bacterium]|jgi:glutaredoxin|nr:glutaredoxin family protein [Verrucomicrobiae bacterium]